MSVEVKSEITGKVWKIEMKEGQAVQEDDIIVILESMKMEIPISAPKAGKITKILVTEGQSVAEGETVALLD